MYVRIPVLHEFTNTSFWDDQHQQNHTSVDLSPVHMPRGRGRYLVAILGAASNSEPSAWVVVIT